jgi:hypothetical protein
MIGVQIQTAVKATCPKAQPHPKAMHNPQKNDRTLYQHFMPQLKHLNEFLQTLILIIKEIEINLYILV